MLGQAGIVEHSVELSIPDFLKKQKKKQPECGFCSETNEHSCGVLLVNQLKHQACVRVALNYTEHEFEQKLHTREPVQFHAKS